MDEPSIFEISNEISSVNLDISSDSSSDSSVDSNAVATMTVSLETASKCLIKFDGDRNKLREFIDNCESALKIIKEEDKAVMFEIIKTKVTGKAKLLSQNREFDNWNALKNYLENAYSEKRSQAQWELELHSCRQNRNESVHDYSNKIENCMVKLINSLDSSMTRVELAACEKLIRNQTLNVFISGLVDPLITIVKSQNPKCLEDAFDIALAEERETISRRETQKFRNVSSYDETRRLKCSVCGRNGHLAHNCFKNITHRPAGFSSQQGFSSNSNYSGVNQPRVFIKSEPVRAVNAHSNSNRNFRNPDQRNANSKFCRYCKHPGHDISECRKRQYYNSRRQFSQNSGQNQAHLNSQAVQRTSVASDSVPSTSALHQETQVRTLQQYIP